MTRILQMGFMLLISNLYGDSVEWLTKVSDVRNISEEGKEKEIHIRIVIGGSWGPEECYYEIVSDATLEELFPDPYASEKKFRIVRATVDDEEVREFEIYDLSGLIELLAENDFFDLPESNRNQKMNLIYIKDPFNLAIYAKVHGKKNFTYRDNFHVVSNAFYEEIREVWTNKAR